MKEVLASKWFTYAVIGGLVILLLAIKSCGNSQISELRGKNELLQEQVDKAKVNITLAEAQREQRRDSTNNENLKRDSIILSLKSKVSFSEQKVKTVTTEWNAYKASQKTKTTEENAAEIESIFGNNSISIIGESLQISNTMPSKILETYYDMEYYRKINGYKDMQLLTKDSIYNTVYVQLTSTKQLLFEAEKSIDSYKELSLIQEEFSKSLTKENKKLTNKNKYLFPAGVVLGILTGLIIN